MTPQHRTYAVPEPELPEDEWPTFTLTGRYTSKHPEQPGAEWSETYHCVPIPPVGVLSAYASAARTDGQGATIFEAPQVQRFLAGVISVPDEVAAFFVLCADRFRLVPLATLVDVMMDLGADYYDRPTGPASD